MLPAFLFSDALTAELCSCRVGKVDSGESVRCRRADVKNSWMREACEATWHFPFCLEATSQAVVKVEGGGTAAPSSYLSLSSFPLFYPPSLPPSLSCCVYVAVVSQRRWRVAVLWTRAAGLNTLTGCNMAATSFFCCNTSLSHSKQPRKHQAAATDRPTAPPHTCTLGLSRTLLSQRAF